MRPAGKMSGKEKEAMTTQVTATVVGGMLKPDESLQLAEHTRVNLTIEPIEDWSPEERLAAWEALKAWLKEHPLRLGGKRYSRDELYDRR
jgi:hypothetical protein